MKWLVVVALCVVAGCAGSHEATLRNAPKVEVRGAGAPKAWDEIVIHHSGQREGSVSGIEAKVKAMVAPAFRYHWLIGNGRGMGDGEVVPTDAWKEQWHHPLKSVRQIDICMIGDFEHDQPTRAQLAACVRLLAKVMTDYGIDDRRVYAHREIKPVECPGPLCDIGAIRKAARELHD